MPKLETKYPAPHCPRCNGLMNAYTHPTMDISPQPGDVALCGECKSLSVYTDMMQLRPTTLEEIKEMWFGINILKEPRIYLDWLEKKKIKWKIGSRITLVNERSV